jgi:hypothetical protein
MVMGAFVTAFIPFLLDFLDTELDRLVPSQALFGPRRTAVSGGCGTAKWSGTDDGAALGQGGRRAGTPRPSRVGLTREA